MGCVLKEEFDTDDKKIDEATEKDLPVETKGVDEDNEGDGERMKSSQSCLPPSSISDTHGALSWAWSSCSSSQGLIW